jgi:hypothetical protein
MRRARHVVSIVSTAAVVALVGARNPEAIATFAVEPASGQQLTTLVGFVDGMLRHVDPQRLDPVPGRAVLVGSGGCAASQGGTACWSVPAWAASPNGTRVVVARNAARSLRVVGVSALRVVADVRLGLDGGSVGALAWLTPRRVLAVQETFGERQRVLAVDVTTRRVVARRPLDGTVTQLGRTGRELVLLVAPGATIGAAKVAVVDPRGTVRSVRLDRISVGWKLLAGRGHRLEARSPALAVDPRGRRAFVVAQSVVAEIDLRTLAVSYHSLDRPTSLLSRLRSWLEPVANAKQVSGYHRQARWLGGDAIAVAGTDTKDGRYEPAGLRVVDTRTWRTATVEGAATRFDVAGDLLLATGGRWDPERQQNVGIGVAAYANGVEQRFRLFDGRQAWVALVLGGHAYVGFVGPAAAEPLQIVDLASGRVVGARERPLPWLLVGAAAGGRGG